MESIRPVSTKEVQLLLKFFRDKKLLTPDPGAALKLDAAVPLIGRETGGLGREIVTFCRLSNVVPWSVAANGAPADTMIKAYRKASHGAWSDKVREFLQRQKESDARAFQVSCTVIGQLFVNERIVSDPPEAWRSSGFFVDTPGGWLPSCPTVRTAILALAEDAAQDVFKDIITTLMRLGDELQWKALEMLVQRPFVPSGGSIALPLIKMDGTDTKHTLPLQFTRVIQFDADNVDRYLARTDIDFKLGKGDFVISYPNFPAIDLFGCTRDGTAVFIQVSLSAYKDKRRKGKDMRALFTARGELNGHSVYDFFRLAISDPTILPARAATTADTSLCATAKYVFVTTTKAQGVTAATAGDAYLCNYDLLNTFSRELAALFPAKD